MKWLDLRWFLCLYSTWHLILSGSSGTTMMIILHFLESYLELITIYSPAGKSFLIQYHSRNSLQKNPSTEFNGHWIGIQMHTLHMVGCKLVSSKVGSGRNCSNDNGTHVWQLPRHSSCRSIHTLVPILGREERLGDLHWQRSTTISPRSPA